jgi:hypothetical protein
MANWWYLLAIKIHISAYLVIIIRFLPKFLLQELLYNVRKIKKDSYTNNVSKNLMMATG